MTTAGIVAISFILINRIVRSLADSERIMEENEKLLEIDAVVQDSKPIEIPIPSSIVFRKIMSTKSLFSVLSEDIELGNIHIFQDRIYEKWLRTITR